MIRGFILLLALVACTPDTQRFNPVVQHATSECYTSELHSDGYLREAALADTYLWKMFCGDEAWYTEKPPPVLVSAY
jgi:hypothetical protein